MKHRFSLNHGLSLCLSLLVLCSLNATVNAEIKPAEGVYLFEDTTASLTVDEVIAMPDAFVNTTNTHIGFSDSAFWIRVDLKNDTNSPQTQVVQFRSHTIPFVEAYTAHDGAFDRVLGGRSVPKADRPLPAVLPSFPVELDSNSAVSHYFKLTSPYQIELGFTVTDLTHALTNNFQLEALRFALMLATLVLLIYSVASAIITKQPVYWLYVGFLSCGFLTHLMDIWLVALPYGYGIYAAAASLGFGMLFMTRLFEQHRHGVLRGFGPLFGLVSLGLFAVLDYESLYRYLSEIMMPFGTLLLTVQLIVANIQGKPYSRLIGIGWIAFIVGVMLTLFAMLGILPSEYHAAFAVGGVIEATVFSIALAYRLRDQDQTVELLKEQKRLNERQKELFAVVGHELRTPVAAMSMIGRDSDIQTNTAREQMTDLSDHLLEVLEDLRIVVAPDRALALHTPQSCDPVQFISRALTPLSSLLKQNAVELRFNVTKTEGAHFLINAQPLRQVVTNLTKNAALHSGGTVVSVTFDYQSGEQGEVLATLTVEDDGKGIPLALRERVFESFGRGDTDKEGSGLGLFIVKEIATLMNGTITYSTSDLGGACFTLMFPMKAVESAPAQSPTSVSIDGLRILLAEDDAMLRMLTEKSLGKRGAKVLSCHNGEQALATFNKEPFDLVLSDLMMPLMDGHELTKAIRATGSTVPIIGVTAAVIGEETDNWLKDGANDFIAKPITPEKLQAALLSIGYTAAG